VRVDVFGISGQDGRLPIKVCLDQAKPLMFADDTNITASAESVDELTPILVISING
jgi:hypothetical protein